MAFSLRIGPMLVTADTAAEAAELVRALGGVPANEATPPPEPPSLPAAVVAPATEVTASATSDKPERKWPIGRGAIFKQENRFVLEISVEGKSDRRGSFKNREDAARAQEETYQARLRGDPLPIYVWRRCRRCGVIGHTAVKCNAPVAVEQLDEHGPDQLLPAVAIPPPAIAGPALQKGHARMARARGGGGSRVLGAAARGAASVRTGRV